MVVWALSLLLVAHGIVVGFVCLSHLGSSPDERLPPFRFGLVLAATLLLSGLTFVGLPGASSDLEATALTTRELFVVLVLVPAWGSFFGSIGVILYGVAGGLPDPTEAP